MIHIIALGSINVNNMKKIIYKKIIKRLPLSQINISEAANFSFRGAPAGRKFFISGKIFYIPGTSFFPIKYIFPKLYTEKWGCPFYTDTVGKNPYKDCPPKKAKLRRHFNPFKTFKSRFEMSSLIKTLLPVVGNLRIFSPVFV